MGSTDIVMLVFAQLDHMGGSTMSLYIYIYSLDSNCLHFHADVSMIAIRGETDNKPESMISTIVG